MGPSEGDATPFDLDFGSDSVGPWNLFGCVSMLRRNFKVNPIEMEST
jgi:hypothetical protein